MYFAVFLFYVFYHRYGEQKVFNYIKRWDSLLGTSNDRLCWKDFTHQVVRGDWWQDNSDIFIDLKI